MTQEYLDMILWSFVVVGSMIGVGTTITVVSVRHLTHKALVELKQRTRN